jgi:hypothetical protein
MFDLLGFRNLGEQVFHFMLIDIRFIKAPYLHLQQEIGTINSLRIKAHL